MESSFFKQTAILPKTVTIPLPTLALRLCTRDVLYAVCPRINSIYSIDT